MKETAKPVPLASPNRYHVPHLLADLALTAVALRVAGIARQRLPFGVEVGAESTFISPGLMLLTLLLWTAVFGGLGVYRQRSWEGGAAVYGKVGLAVAVGTVLLSSILYLSFRDLPRLQVVYFFLLDLLILVGYRFALRAAVATLKVKPTTRRALVVGLGDAARRVAAAMRAQQAEGLELVGLVAGPNGHDQAGGVRGEYEGLPVLGALSSIGRLVHQHSVEEVIVALPFHDRRQLVNLVASLQRVPAQVSVVPDGLDLALHGGAREIGGVPLLHVGEPTIDGFDRLAKRIFDVVVSGAALVVLGPVMLAVALAIKLDSPGPIIFRQMRVGEGGRLFPMLKFRSMVDGADTKGPGMRVTWKDGVPVHKVPADPRVTRIGFFIRRTSLDELPQLFNVLRGDMSLVGPRPEMPYIVEHYEPWQWARFSVPQGMTGWWQVNGRGDKLMHLHTEDDIYYIHNYSFFLDLKILWRTIEVVASGKGAY